MRAWARRAREHGVDDVEDQFMMKGDACKAEDSAHCPELSQPEPKGKKMR